jgi:hypothetical protein
VSERRQHSRIAAWAPISIVGRDLVVVVRDLSRGGLLVASAAELAQGEALELELVSPLDGVTLTLSGVVVRCEPNTSDPDGVFSHLVAISLTSERPELEALAQALGDLRAGVR